MRTVYRKTLCLSFCFLLLGLSLTACAKKTKSVSQTGVAMGSVVSVKLYGEDEKALKNIDTLHIINETDKRLSKNMDGSEIKRLNSAGGNAYAVSPETYAVLQKALEIYAHSQNRVAVTSGALTELWGIDTDDFQVPRDTEIQMALPTCDDAKVQLLANHMVSIGKGQIINLGSVGKGVACDDVIKMLKENANVQGGIVSVGGSIGVYGKSPKGDTWSVGIRNPFENENSYFGVLSLENAFVSTSGNYEKTFTDEKGNTYHHLLDLKTGYPVKNDLSSVTVIAKTGLQSDALSTLCYILGKEEACKVLKLYSAQAVFVYQDKTVFATEGIKEQLRITSTDFQLL